jgi:glycosyltransferase involved in cell wall biosynthesis
MVNNKKKHKHNTNVLPLVSLCTPTFNRRPFIPFMIKCFEHQTYPKDRIEWIIVDDGTDPIGDLVSHIPQVKYFYYPEKMNLGKKRNTMHSKCSGDIIIYMDDDDYYPPERITHAVDVLQKNPKFLIAGSSEMHIYFDSRDKVFQFGPYAENHATAATFAFRKELLKNTGYVDNALLAEEKHFLKDYTIPLKQLDTLKTILVFSHKHNTLNKDRFLENPQSTVVKESRYAIDDFVKDPELKKFYMLDMNTLLENYEPGRPENKPKLLEQIKLMEEERKKRIEDHNKMLEARQKLMNTFQGNLVSQNEVEMMKAHYEKQLADKNYLINELLKKTKELTSELNGLKKMQSLPPCQP